MHVRNRLLIDESRDSRMLHAISWSFKHYNVEENEKKNGNFRFFLKIILVKFLHII